MFYHPHCCKSLPLDGGVGGLSLYRYSVTRKQMWLHNVEMERGREGTNLPLLSSYIRTEWNGVPSSPVVASIMVLGRLGGHQAKRANKKLEHYKSIRSTTGINIFSLKKKDVKSHRPWHRGVGVHPSFIVQSVGPSRLDSEAAD